MDACGDPLLSGDELAVFVEAFQRTGFRGGINWYRNMDRNNELIPAAAHGTITIPRHQRSGE
jgi:hypothetical protein